ncbi:MAG TPA: TIM-barrel domain-containing protein [Phnomibacter sp.]|nr:TIM-barrel domain-containing protein [Phnomibacter sp.]
MKNILFSLLFFVAAIVQAQPTSKGSWSASTYPNQAILLSWKHQQMQHGEHIGDAMLAKPTSNKTEIASTPIKINGRGDKPITLSLSGNGIIIQIPGSPTIQILQAFDSGHIRGLQVAMPQKAPWYGGGERTLPLNRVGQRIPLYNNAQYAYELNVEQLNYSVPFVFTTAGFGLLFDNPAKGYIDFGKTRPGILEAGFFSGDVNVLIIPGKTPAEIIANYALITGRQPLPPRWALGNFASRFGYRSQQQVEEIVQRMQQENFPLDAVIIDIFWFGDSIKGTLGNLDWVNKTKWPTPDKMLAAFRKQSIKTILVTEPFVVQGTKNFEASKPYLAKDASGNPYMHNQFYFGYGGLLDLFTPEARTWFWKFYKTQTDLGVTGWWGDLGEPENHPADEYHDLSDFGISRKVGANEVHNMYGHMWSKMLFENWKKHYPQKRIFFLNRAGYAGTQRYSVFPWTGDVARSWGGLKAQLPNLQSMSISGLPYIHSDAGGFTSTPEKDEVLYTRWLQMAAFTPILRPHGTALEGLDPEAHDLPSEPIFKNEPYKSIVRNAINTRYSLIPYIYTMAWEQAAQGSPMIRPMFYNGITDTALLRATEQYMFGNNLLVAPVLAPNLQTQKIYLPEGNWYNFTNNQWREGKQWIDEPLQLENIPVFVKAGSIIPIWHASKYANTAQYTPDQPLTLRLYPGKNTLSGFVYDDDGENPYAMQNKEAHQLIEWNVAYTKGNIVLTLTPRNWPGNFSRRFDIQVPAKFASAFGEKRKPVAKLNQKAATLLAAPSDSQWLQIPVVMRGKKIELIITPSAE